MTHSVKLTFLDTDSENHTDGSSVSALSAEKLGVYYQGDIALAGSPDHTLTLALDHEQEEFSQSGTAIGVFV